MNGNPASNTPNRHFLLDESSAPVVARALQSVGYPFSDTEAAMGQRGTQDPEIIQWCKENDAVWVHADDRAMTQHRSLLQTSGIRTLRIRRNRGQMLAREQLRILAFVLPVLEESWKRQPRVRHYKASAINPLSKPSLRGITL